MPVASKVMPGSLAESSLARSRSSARSSAPSSFLTVMPSALLAALIHCAHLVELAVEVGLLLAGAERDPLERRPGHDDAVPVAGGAAGDELAAPVPLQVLLPGGQQLGLRVELEPFPGELLEHVVRDDDRGLADQAEAAQLHHAHDHLGGLARADLVGQQHRGLGDHPGDRRDLVRPGPEGQGQAGQGQLRRRRSCAAPGC